jgi:hypothetical protein
MPNLSYRSITHGVNANHFHFMELEKLSYRRGLERSTDAASSL